jgi:glucose-6-phosphate 1-dehydrogenase
MVDELVVLGASGDLAGRYLFPALVRLQVGGAVSNTLTVIGVDREDWDDGAFRRHAAESLAVHASDAPPDARSELADKLRYRRADVTDRHSLARVADELLVPPSYISLCPTRFSRIRFARWPAATSSP